MNTYDPDLVNFCLYRIYLTFPFKQPLPNSSPFALQKRAAKIAAFQKIVHDYLLKNKADYRSTITSWGLIIAVNDEKIYRNFSVPGSPCRWED